MRLTLKVSVEIVITCVSKEAATILLKATNPDNLKVPPPLKVEGETSGNDLVIRVEHADLGTVIATVDDLLINLKLAEDTLNLVRDVERGA